MSDFRFRTGDGDRLDFFCFLISTTEEDELELERDADVEDDRVRFDVFLFFFDVATDFVVDFLLFFCERSLAVDEAETSRCGGFSGFRL